jgi:hypothetical protein
MDDFELKGIWKGEYVYDDKVDPVIVKTPVPFMLKVRVVDEDGLFEGMCQDDPSISKMEFAAEIYGRLNGRDLIFSKRYPKTVFVDSFGSVVTLEQPQPDVIYQARISSPGKVFGTWKVEKTFRKINEKVMEIGPVTGVWWMERL